ncbi:hypothetical protein UFOVP247_15 [uncultured Caudovirales phage]|uniref:Uncharacterized protein n=1 Tax=uncultured Caudovirales phage TaxID=2100421 RepID=A0A6J7WSC2_9CAUD|nr:hypothetical protein UFOVP247_15 [uncultured Caudovirales phage]
MGGMCGDFLANLINRALNPEAKSYFHNERLNKYRYPNGNVFLRDVKNVTVLFDTYYDKYTLEHYRYIRDTFKRNSFNSNLEIYNVCYSPDHEEFERNVEDYIRDSLILEDEYTVASWHYYKKEKFFDIKNIYENSIPLLLCTDSDEYTMLFFALYCIKTNFFYIKNHKDGDMYWRDVDRRKYSAFDGMIPVDSGKLFFEKGYEDEFENILRSNIKSDLTVDREWLRAYNTNNVSLLTQHFGSDVMDLTAYELKERIFGHVAQQDRASVS